MADVAVVRWPEERDEVERLARLRLPRLLLIAESADPPEGSDVLQDWVRLSPINGRLGRVLSDAFNSVVAEEKLLASGWPTGRPSSNSLRVHIHRMRRRLRPLGLEVLAVRGEGWVLQVASAEQI